MRVSDPVSTERFTTCLDFARRFDGFLDGELDAHSMRAMALHASHCSSCGVDLERAETAQSLISQAVDAEVERLDVSRLWAAVEGAIGAPRPAWRRRLGEALDWPRRVSPLPALALGGALAALLAALLWPGSTTVEPVEVANNHARIERIASSAAQVAVWSEPVHHTTAIWVASYEPESAP